MTIDMVHANGPEDPEAFADFANAVGDQVEAKLGWWYAGSSRVTLTFELEGVRFAVRGPDLKGAVPVPEVPTAVTALANAVEASHA